MSMHFIEVAAPGEADQLFLRRGPRPALRAGEVQIAVSAAGVNRPDILQRQGLYPPPADASPLLGLEVAGRIAAVGSGVHAWRVGDPVCALAPGGGYAEYTNVPAVHCLPIPAGFSFIQAAAIIETLFTVWHNVFQRGSLTAGETLLVHGGASGIGTTAIQLAVARGARVLATAGSQAKCRACEALGAERAIHYREEDFVEICRQQTNGRGVDVILDMVGGHYVQRNFRAAAVDGRLVSIGVQEGARAEVNAGLLMAKRLTWTGSTLRAQSMAAKADIARAVQEEVWPLLEHGRVRPIIDRVFPLSEARAAHRYLESGQSIGKLVLQVRDDAVEVVDAATASQR